MITRRLFWLVCAVVQLAPAAADPQVDALRQYNSDLLRQRRQDRALTVRDVTVATDRARQAELLVFCRQKGITRLFVTVPTLTARAGLSPLDEFGWRQLLANAHRQGLSVHAIVGNTGWIADHGRALDALQRLTAFCERSRPGEQFDGVLFEFPLFSELQRLFAPPDELEPPAEEDLLNGVTSRRDVLTGARGRQPAERPAELPPGEDPALESADTTYPDAPYYDRATIAPIELKNQELLRQYLTVMRGLKQYLQGPRHGRLRLAVGVTFPAWLRVPVGDQDRVQFVHEQLVDLGDYVVVHNMPGQTTDIGRASELVLRYAGQTGKQALLRLELQYPRSTLPSLVTLFGRDEWFVEELLRSLLYEHSGAPGFGGVVLDDYLGYRAIPAVRPLPADLRPLPPRPRDSGGAVRG